MPYVIQTNEWIRANVEAITRWQNARYFTLWFVGQVNIETSWIDKLRNRKAKSHEFKQDWPNEGVNCS